MDERQRMATPRSKPYNAGDKIGGVMGTFPLAHKN